MTTSRHRRGGFTVVETLVAVVVALSAVALVGALGPLSEGAELAAQRRTAVRAAENLRAIWVGGRPPSDRAVGADEWMHLTPDDARLWWADREGWGPWAEEGARPASRQPAPGFVYELALVRAGDRGVEPAGAAASAWLVVSWPAREADGAWVPRARRQSWSLPVGMGGP